MRRGGSRESGGMDESEYFHTGSNIKTGRKDIGERDRGRKESEGAEQRSRCNVAAVLKRPPIPRCTVVPKCCASSLFTKTNGGRLVRRGGS